jgi:hypothetical protein
VNSVTTPWAVVGNTASCVVDTTFADGIPEGYCYAAPAATLLADLGITEADIHNGVKSLLVAVRLRKSSATSTLMGVALARSVDGSGNASSFTGGGGGLAVDTSNPLLVNAMAFDTTQDASDFEDVAWSGSSAIVRITGAGGYLSVETCQKIDADADTTNNIPNVSGNYIVGDQLWLVLWAGCNGTALVTDLEMSLWFAVIDGPNFSAVPA